MTRAGDKKEDKTDLDKVPGLIEFVKVILASLSSPIEEEVLDVEDLNKDSTPKSPIQEIVNQDALRDMTCGRNSLDQNPDQELIDSQSILEKTADSSATINPIDIREWSRKNQRKKK